MEQIWTTTIGKQNGIDLLNALAQWHCSNVEPVITYPCQNWADTGNNVWKQRNVENTEWIIRGKLSEAYFGINTYIEGVKKYRLLVINGSLAMEEVS